MITLLSILALTVIIIFIGKIRLSRRFQKQVKRLFAISKKMSGKVFDYSQLDGLPEPVQRYFKHVLKEGQQYISYARITHDGLFKTGVDKGWVKIKGEQYATTYKPGFIWKGVTSLFTARDMYIDDEGRLLVSLLSVINIVDGKGAQYNQGELLRWFGESILYPTNLLPSDKLQWTAIDKQTAKMMFTYHGLYLSFIVTINDIGEITQLETERYMDESHLEKWVIKIADYKELNGIEVPTSFEVLWRLQDGDFSYAKFNMNRIEYDIPELF